jgi:hypothetical protein
MRDEILLEAHHRVAGTFRRSTTTPVTGGSHTQVVTECGRRGTTEGFRVLERATSVSNSNAAREYVDIFALIG